MLLCNCVNPFCDLEHTPYISDKSIERPADLDEWEGPEAAEYSEYDAEAYDEMVRDDLAGRS